MGTEMLVLVEAGHAGGPGEAGPRPFALLWGWVGLGGLLAEEGGGQEMLGMAAPRPTFQGASTWLLWGNSQEDAGI